jgi:hypothetical protein
MEYTIYDSDGYWLGTATCTFENDVPVLATNQQVIKSHYSGNTMLVNGSVVPAANEALSIYNEKLLNDLRGKRNNLLSNSDWTDLPHCPLSESKKLEWQAYRTALRNITESITDLEAPVWPLPPQ